MGQLEIAHDTAYGPTTGEWDDRSPSSTSTSYPVAPSPAPVAALPSWGVPLQPGHAFLPGQVGAIITKQGLFVWAMPGQYFDTTPQGRKIRLRHLIGPEPTESDPLVEEWNAVGQVLRIVSLDELRAGRPGTVAMSPNTSYVTPSALNPPAPANPHAPKGRRSFWLQGLVAFALGAAIVGTYLMESRSDAATANQWLLALIGLGGLLIFAVAAAAIMQAAAST